jgi:hypothetical protein
MPGAGGDAGAADPRARDVADAERLLAEADSSGVARLPALSTAELWVLCGVDQVIATEPEARWWAGLAATDREKLTRGVLQFLTDRGLLRPAGEREPDAGPGPADGPGLTAAGLTAAGLTAAGLTAAGLTAAGQPGRLLVSAALGMIVAARQNPEVVVIATESDGSVTGTPRMFGVGQAGGLPRAVVGEHVSGKVIRPFGPVHDFSLLSPDRAGHVLALWATRTGGGAAPGERAAGGQPRIVDVYAYTGGELAGRDRATVSGSGDGHLVTRQAGADADPGPSFACDLGGLAGMLTGMLALEQP